MNVSACSDGGTASLWDAADGDWAQTEAPGTLDEMLDDIARRFSLPVPIADGATRGAFEDFVAALFARAAPKASAASEPLASSTPNDGHLRDTEKEDTNVKAKQPTLVLLAGSMIGAVLLLAVAPPTIEALPEPGRNQPGAAGNRR